MPSTRQRSLALAQALGSYPCFNKDRSVLESILNYEQLVLEYEQASGTTYPKELMAATLIKCCQPRLREQIQLSITDTTSYVDIREKITSYERVSKAWTSEQVLKHVNDQPNYASGSNDGPIPMEVDRIEKGKGKQKGKQKGRGSFGGEWASSWAFGRGRGRGRANKGKGKGKTKGKSKGKKGNQNQKGGAKGKKGGGRGKIAYGQCSNCYEFGHWSRDCPHMVNQVSNNKQEPIPPSPATSSTAPAAKANPGATVRRIFQFGGALSNPSSPTSPTSPTSPCLSQVRMVLFHDPESTWTEVVDGECENEWVILDSGSDVSLLPARYQPDSNSNFGSGSLQNCQGGALQTTGTRQAELIAVTTEGEEVLLQHEFIVGNVTSCLVSLGQLYQGGWTIFKDETNDSLSLQSPGNEIRIPVEYRNRSFAIKAQVRQISDVSGSTCVAADGDAEFAVRTVVYVEDEIENAPMDSWEMTSSGTPFFRTVTTDFINPEGVWPFWPYRTTLIRKHQKGRAWTVVELSRKFKDMRNPFGMIDQFLLTIGFEDECETLTLLGVEPQSLLDLGLVVVDESGDVVFGQEEFGVTGLRDEIPESKPSSSSNPMVLPPDDGGRQIELPEVEPGEEIQAAPEVELQAEQEMLVINDDLVVTPSSTIRLLRDACRWLGISQSGSRTRMYDRCKKAVELALKREAVLAAQEQYKSLQLDAQPISVPPQPSDRERELHDLTHVPFQPWCKYCVMSRSKADHHSHVPDPAGEAQREFPTIQCDFFFMEPGKEGAVVALLMVDVWSRYAAVAPLKQRNAQTVGRALVTFIGSVRDGTVELAFDNEPVLVAGANFCKSVRAKSELTTHFTANKVGDKSRTSMAERFVQTIRGIQKP